jgi:SAM-dependent methyltransferase
MGRPETDYRAAIYHDYARVVQGKNAAFDRAAADRWAPCLDYYLRGWLPRDRDANVADLGCGAGRVLYLLSKKGYRNLTGVDGSASQTAIARQVVESVETMDALCWLRDRAAALDLVLAIDLLEHLNKDEGLEFIDLCASCLRPGGRLILQTPNAASPFFGAVRYGDYTHEQSFTPASLAALLTRAGLAGVEAREAGPVPWRYSTRSTVRYGCWRIVRLALALVNLIETGSPGSGILSRVFLVSAVKPRAS